MSVDTFERRVERTFAARTVAELRSVVADVTAERSWLRQGVARFRRSGSRACPRCRSPFPPTARSSWGAATAATSSLEHPTVSRRHLELRPAGEGEWLATDVGSLNGTWLAEPPRRARRSSSPATSSGSAPARSAWTELAARGGRRRRDRGGRARARRDRRGAVRQPRGRPGARSRSTPRAPGRAVPAPFLGLSMEWTSVAPFGGPARAGDRRAAAARRGRRGRAAPLRIGGASAEESWWNPTHRRPRPPDVRHDIDAPRSPRSPASRAASTRP